MFVSTQAIPQIASEYLSEVIFPKVSSPLGQFGIGFVLPYLTSSLEARVTAMLPSLKLMGIVDENNRIDLDKAYAAAKDALEKAGGRITVYNYTADNEDLVSLYEIAKRHAVAG